MATAPAIRPSSLIVAHPLRFIGVVLSRFRANQGLLLAGAVAYYTLLSLIPLLILLLIALSHVIDEARLLATLSEYLEFVVPGQSGAIVDELRGFLAHRETIGGVLLVSMIVFSALAFTVLENAMSVIFFHRVSIRRRRFIVSALMPYVFIVFLPALCGWSCRRDTVADRHYLVMPVGRLSIRHALIGGVAAGLLWEITRHLLVWYYGTISQIQVVYGSLTAAIAVLLSVEIGAIVLLLGARVIAEYERLGREPRDWGTPALRTRSEERRVGKECRSRWR